MERQASGDDGTDMVKTLVPSNWRIGSSPEPVDPAKKHR